MRALIGVVVVLGVGLAHIANATLIGPLAVTVVADKADLICVCVPNVVAPGDAEDDVSLNVLYMIKGAVPALSLQAALPAAADGYAHTLTPALIGTPGVWFLVSNGSKYRVQPLYKGLYSERDAYIPVSPKEIQSPPGGTVHDQVLSYAVDAYRTGKHTSAEDQRLLTSLEFASLPEVTTSVGPLANSTSLEDRVIAISASLRVNSEAAIQGLSADTLIASSVKFATIAEALQFYYTPKSSSGLDDISELVKTRKITSLDASLASVLQRAAATDLGRQAPVLQHMMDAMAFLLESTDSEARLRASAFFGYIAMFADGKGSLSASNVVGPLSTTVTREFTPRQGASLTVSQYVQFWKTWWLQNRSAVTSVP